MSDTESERESRAKRQEGVKKAFESPSDSGQSHLEQDTTSHTDTEVSSVGRRGEDEVRKHKEPGRYEAEGNQADRPAGKSTMRDKSSVNPGGGGHSPKS